jgi:hypothetical protein
MENVTALCFINTITCKHVMGLAIRLKLTSPPFDAKNMSIGHLLHNNNNLLKDFLIIRYNTNDDDEKKEKSTVDIVTVYFPEN